MPFLIGADGPKGAAVAREVGDGIITVAPRPGWPWCAVLMFGTVLADGESPDSPRVLDAAGHAGSVALHAMYERRRQALDTVPGGREWVDALTAEVPEAERHLVLHEGHLVHIASRDTAVVTGALLNAVGAARTTTGWAERFEQLIGAGATEIAYQPAGGDIAGELARFADAFRAWGGG